MHPSTAAALQFHSQFRPTSIAAVQKVSTAWTRWTRWMSGSTPGRMDRIHSPLLGCYSDFARPPSLLPQAPSLLLLLLLLHRLQPSGCPGPRRPPPVLAAAVGACWSAWPWPAGSAGAGRRSVAAPAPGAPASRSRSGSRSCCDAAGRARSSAGVAPSPRCVAV